VLWCYSSNSEVTKRKRSVAPYHTHIHTYIHTYINTPGILFKPSKQIPIVRITLCNVTNVSWMDYFSIPISGNNYRTEPQSDICVFFTFMKNYILSSSIYLTEDLWCLNLLLFFLQAYYSLQIIIIIQHYHHYHQL
jgi:hypothetical protein